MADIITGRCYRPDNIAEYGAYAMMKFSVDMMKSDLKTIIQTLSRKFKNYLNKPGLVTSIGSKYLEIHQNYDIWELCERMGKKEDIAYEKIWII